MTDKHESFTFTKPLELTVLPGTNDDMELNAIQALHSVMAFFDRDESQLTNDARARVAQWFYDRYGATRSDAHVENQEI